MCVVAVVHSSEIADGQAPARYWLFKSEPEPRIVNGIDVSYGIDKLIAEDDQIADWDGTVTMVLSWLSRR